MNLASGVKTFIEKSKKGTLSDEEAVSSLGLIAHERKKFLKTLKTVEEKFQRRLEEVKMLSKQKAKQGMELITKQVCILFKEEWDHIID